MQLHFYVFAFILGRSGCFGAQWQILENFKDIVTNYSRTGKEVAKLIEDFIEKKKQESLEFLYSIDHMPHMERNELRPYCTEVHKRLEGLVYSFKIDIVKLETPLISRRLEIIDRLSDIVPTVEIYQNLAENKYGNCRLSAGNRNCEDDVVSWLKDEVDKMLCKLSACREKKNHPLDKRSVLNCDGFQCRNGECINNEQVCNGDRDCIDNSDETPGCERYCFNGFHCRDLRCIERFMVCNGIPDCLDGSDEEYCRPPEELYTATNCSSEEGNFLCSNKHCVALAVVCDSKDDCGDSSDESPKCRQDIECAAGCTAGGGVCVPGPKSSFCLSECPEGMLDNGGLCLAGPQHIVASLEQLMGEVPYFLERYTGALGFLKRRLISSLDKALVTCRGPLSSQVYRDHIGQISV